MTKNIIFCGTPDFATASLQTLFKYHKKGHFNLSSVITIPDKKIGRGQKKQQSAVKKTAKKLNIPTLEPSELTDKIFLNKIKSLKPDLMIVIAFKKLPKILFEIPKLGTINLHASLLPKYRGAAPINWAIINGEIETGLTTFFINEKIDTGDIILQSKIEIQKHWHAKELHDKLMEKSPEIIIDTIEKIFTNNYNLKKQNHIKKEIITQELPIAPKIEKKDRIFNPKHFQGSTAVKKAYDFIRGMSPPGVRIKIEITKTNNVIKSQTILITKVCNYTKEIEHTLNERIKHPINKSELSILKRKNHLIITNPNEECSFQIKKIKPENSKEMSDKEFINGFLNTDFKNIRIANSD
jgi:methionyl-tRNA formyltransferase